MALDFLFALRGLLAFVAFTEFITAARCLIPLPDDTPQTASFVQSKIFSLVPLDHRSDRIISHLYAYISFANALVLSHLAVFSHYRPLVSLSFSALSLKVTILKYVCKDASLVREYVISSCCLFPQLIFIFSHVVLFKTVQADHNLISPVISTVAALVAVICMPFVAPEEQVLIPAKARTRRRCNFDDENEELLTTGFVPRHKKEL